MRPIHRILFLLLLLGAAGPICLPVAAQDDDGIDIEEGDGTVPPATDEEKPRKEAPPARTEAFPRREKGQKVKWVELDSEEKGHSIKLPDDWVLKPRAARDAVFCWDVLLPGTEGGSYFAVLRRPDMGDPRPLPSLWREETVKRLEASECEVRAKPLPQLVLTYRQGTVELVELLAFLRIRGMGFVAQMDFPKAEYDEVHEDFLKALESFEADIELHPAIPEEYKTKPKGRFLFACHPGVKGSISQTQKIILGQEKAFEKFHGKLPKADRHAPTVVYVHATKAAAAEITPQASESSQDFFVDHRHHRLFVVPVARGNAEQAGLLASAVQGLLFDLKYGQPRPLWAFYGEGTVARAEEMTGKPLPNMHEGFLGWTATMTMGRLDELESIRESDNESYSKQSFFYVCMFRCGDSNYRKAYKTMLERIEETLDYEAAEKEFFAAIDPAQAANDANSFMRLGLRGVKPK